MLRRAEVANMFPWVPAAITANDATNTMKSMEKEGEERVEVKGEKREGERKETR